MVSAVLLPGRGHWRQRVPWARCVTSSGRRARCAGGVHRDRAVRWVLHVVFAAVILAWTSHRFNAIVARAPQLDPLEAFSPAANVSWAAAGR